MTTVEVLREARARYAASPSHAPYGAEVRPDEACAVYAVNGPCASAAASERYMEDRAKALRALCCAADVPYRRYENRPIIDWNARNTTATVLAAFDRAIAACEAK